MKSSEPIRLPDAIARVVDRATRVRPWSVGEKELGWRRLSGRLTRHGWPRLGWALAGAGAAATLALALMLLLPKPSAPSRATAVAIPRGERTVAKPASAPPAAEIGVWTGGTLSVSPNAQLELHGAAFAQLHFSLREGTVSVRGGSSVRVDAPSVRVAGISRRFGVSVEHEVTRVTVFEGHLRLERGARTVEIGPGETVLSTDPRLDSPSSGPHASPVRRFDSVPAAAVSRAERFAACARTRPAAAAAACYEELAHGSDLVAANARYAFAVLERDALLRPDRALQQFRAYQTQFPDGVLAPEVALAVIDLRTRAHQDDDALAEADRFLARFGNHSAAARVRAIRATLSHDSP